MNVFINKTLQKLEEKLSHLEQEHDSVLKRSELCFNESKTSLELLKQFIIKHKFKNESEEIHFFKELKPQFASKLVFYLMLYNIETKKPNGGREILKRYYIKELEKLKHYFDYNLDFYRYYRSGATYLDHKYFIRDKFDIQLTLDGYIFENDTRFCTTHDFKVAKILAHDRLQVFLEEELTSIDRKESSFAQPNTNQPNLVWSDSKTSLIELIYALQAQGAFNNGNADIKEIAAFFETVFNIDLGEYYRTYLEIRSRKINRTKYLSSLTERLIRRMDEQDEK